jgi:hypothetical protein
VRVEMPGDGFPEVYHGLASGYRIVTGDTFKVQLSNGVFVTVE